MKYLRQLIIILSVYFLGNLIQNLLHIPVPGTVLGLIFLFLGLSAGIIKEEMVEEMCEFLLSHMSFLFVPAGVGLMTSMGIISKKWLPFIIIIIISTALVWIITAYVVKFLRRSTKDEGIN